MRSRDLGFELARVAELGRDRAAVVDEEESLTYGGLLDEARELAAALPAAPNGTAAAIALLLPHRARTIVALVAALLAGRPYCVLNPGQPRRRIEALLAEIEPGLIWASDRGLRAKLAAVGLDATTPAPARKPAAIPARPRLARGQEPGDPCAIYVTSGSSGAPKLVGYRHEATHHRALHYASAIEATPEDRFLLVSPLWAAASASTLFAALLSGASLRLLDPAGAAPSALASPIADAGITAWHSTPSLFRRLAGAGVLDSNDLRVIRLGGEPLLRTDVEHARRISAGRATLVTGYSITEANGIVTQRAIPLAEAGPEPSLDAGPPIDGIDLWIEDREGRPAPAGEEGEIVVGGALLSAGYLDSAPQDGATRFDDSAGTTILRTGDRGVLLEGGSLEVRGRGDRRLKVRGIRVDPAEVEAAALRHDGVLEAASVPFTTGVGTSALALFAVTRGSANGVTAPSLIAGLQELMPPEAMPAAVHVVDGLPLTDSGKVDRARLARRAGDREPGGARARRARRDPVADHLRQLWLGALEIDDLGLDEDFFALGGDSLAAAEVCAGIESTYGIPLEPAVLLRHRSVRALARHVRGLLDGEARAHGSVLRLNPAGRRPPLLVVPGAGSEATALVHFAEALGPEQPVNVIQLPGADGRSRPLTRMDGLVAHCLAAVREAGAGPPYRIAGTSFGGLVAYALASELVRDGVDVEYLGLFDAPAPGTRRPGHLTQPLRRFRAARERQGIATALRHLLAEYRIRISLLLGIDWQPPIALRFRRLRAACSIAAGRWIPPRLAIPVHLYRCETQPEHLAGKPALGWERYAPDIRLSPLPTQHGRHIRPPGVRHLATAVNDDLRPGGAERPKPAP